MSTQFEWTTVEEENDWQALSLPPSPRARPNSWRRWRSPWLWALLGLLLLSVGGGVFTLEHAAQAGWDALEAELHNAVAADAWLARPATSAAPPAVQVVQAEVQAAQATMQAIVQTVVTETLASGETRAYRTTDVYRESAAGWQRVEPSAALLGPLQTRATRYFQIDYYAVDAEVVRALAPRLDALYEQACASFGLSPSALAQRITVDLAELVKGASRTAGHFWRSSSGVAGEVILLPSPLLLQLPVEQPAAEWLYQAAASSVVEAVIWQLPLKMPRGAYRFRWGPLLDALKLWQVRQAGGALAGERVPVFRQMYGTASGAKDSFGVGAACRMDLLWQQTTAVFWICHKLTMQTLRAAGDTLLRSPAQRMRLATANEWGETVALETVVEYAVARYGEERLPRLVQALSDHASWQTLVPAVFGVSAAEFEAGWQAYIAAHYQAPIPQTAYLLIRGRHPMQAIGEPHPFEYGVFTAADADASARLLGATFSRSDPPAVAVGLTPAEFARFVLLAPG
jgi:hypothetical protein